MLTRHEYDQLNNHFRVRVASGSINGTPPPVALIFKEVTTAPPRKPGRPKTRNDLERKNHRRHGWIG